MNIPVIDHLVRLSLSHLTLLLTLVSCTGLSAAQAITGVVNAASYKDPRLPGGLIAESPTHRVRLSSTLG